MAPLRAFTATWLSLVAAAAATTSPSTFAAAAAAAQNHGKRVFIQYKLGNHDNCLRKLHKDTRMDDSSSSTRMIYDFPDIHSFVMEVESNQELQVLRKDPDIEKVYEDSERSSQMMHGSIKPYHPPPHDPHHRRRRPSTSHLRSSQQERQSPTPPQQLPYGVEMVQAPYAWERGIKGAGVKVCVVDSGTERHEDLNQRALDGSVAASFWFQGSDEWYDDTAGHGTHVAGTIAAVDNDIGVIGVAPEADIYAVKYFADDTGFAYSSSLINAAYECRDAGAKIISMSLGGPLPNPFEFLVFDKLLRENGILSFAAAGNSGGHRPSYPASYNGVTSVAAVDRNQAHASFSQRHRRVDLAAPGVDVLSLLPRGGCTECNANGAASGYGTASGTSMATPHAAGVAALLWSFKPSATAQEIIGAIEQSAIDLGDAGRDDYYGHGLIDAKEALILLNGGPFPTTGLGVGAAGGVEIQNIPTSVETMTVDEEDECDEGQVAFHLSLKTDQYGDETSWELVHTLDTSDVVLSGFGFENSRTYDWHKCVPKDCYTFVIHDSADDGLCCDYGSGSFSVSYGGVEMASSDGVFASRQAVALGSQCATGTSDLPVVNIVGSPPSSTSDEATADSSNPHEEEEDEEPEEQVEDTTDTTIGTDEECVEISFTLVTDTFPKETRFELVRRASDGATAEIIWDEKEFAASSKYEYKTCQSPSGCYDFMLLDSHGDGLCCRYGRGSFYLSYDGEVEEADDSFGEKVQVEFGGGC